MNKRAMNAVLCVGCLAALVWFLIRSPFFRDVAPGERGESAAYFSYVMLALFGVMTLVFAWRAAKGGKVTS